MRTQLQKQVERLRELRIKKEEDDASSRCYGKVRRHRRECASEALQRTLDVRGRLPQISSVSIFGIATVPKLDDTLTGCTPHLGLPPRYDFFGSVTCSHAAEGPV